MASINECEIKKVKYREEDKYFQGDLYYRKKYVGGVSFENGEQLLDLNQDDLQEFQELSSDLTEKLEKKRFSKKGWLRFFRTIL